MVVGGVASDRFRQSRVAAIAALVRISFVLLMILALHLNQLNFWAILVFAAIYGISDAFFVPAINSLAPLTVPQSHLKSANSLLQASNQISMIGGPLLGAAMIALSFDAALVAVSILLLVSVGSVMFVREPPTAAPADRASPWAQIKQGIAYVTHSPELKNCLALIVVVNFFFFGPLLMGVPILVAEGLGSSARDLGLLQGSYAAGMITGAVIIGLIPVTRYMLYTTGIITLGVGLLVLGFATHVWNGVALLILMGSISASINVLLITRVQQNAEKNMLGRVMALLSVASSGLLPISYALLGVLV